MSRLSMNMRFNRFAMVNRIAVYNVKIVAPPTRNAEISAVWRRWRVCELVPSKLAVNTHSFAWYNHSRSKTTVQDSVLFPVEWIKYTRRHGLCCPGYDSNTAAPDCKTEYLGNGDRTFIAKPRSSDKGLAISLTSIMFKSYMWSSRLVPNIFRSCLVAASSKREV